MATNLLPLILLAGAAAYMVKKKKKKTNGQTADSTSNGKTNGAELPTVQCVPGQRTGEFLDNEGKLWKWEIDRNKYRGETNLTFTELLEPGNWSRVPKYRKYALDANDETLCEGIKGFFRDQGLGR